MRKNYRMGVEHTEEELADKRLTEEQRSLAGDYLPLARKMANHYAPRMASVSVDDLESAFGEALVYAARTYDPSFGYGFALHAKRWFLKYVSDAIAANEPIHLPATVRKSKKLREQYTKTRVSASGPDYDLIKLITAKPADEDALGFDEIEVIHEQIRRLGTARQAAIHHRWFLGQSLEESGKAIGITAEGVRQREIKALARLKETMPAYLSA